MRAPDSSRLAVASGADAEREWHPGRFFLAVFGIVAAGMLFLGRSYFFGTPLYEAGDLAANSLQIELARHLQDLVGNYSRFGFHHPGPAFFYVYAAGEWLFHDLLHLAPAPHNGQLMAGALLQAGFLATLISVLARFAAPNRRLFAVVAIVTALVHFQLAGNPEFSLWPPEQLVIPFACFLAVAIALACGWVELLPVLVVCGGFLVHGHVAQPLFVVPIAAVAYAIVFWRNRQEAGLSPVGFVRRRLEAHLLALVALGIFLLPLALDAIRPDSNLSQIMASVTAPPNPSDAHSPMQIVAYFLSFLGFPTEMLVLDFARTDPGAFVASHWSAIAALILALVAAPVVLWLALRHVRRPAAAGPAAPGDGPGGWPTGDRRLFTTYYAFVFLAAALTIAWIWVQKGLLYEFNSFFIYGLMFVAILPSALLVCRLPIGRERIATVLAGVLALALTVTTTIPLPLGEEPGAAVLNASVSKLIAERSGTAPPVLLEFSADEWEQALGVALTLQRGGVAWFVEPGQGLRFGTQHEYLPTTGGPVPEQWFLVPPAEGRGDQIDLGDGIAIYPAPPSLVDLPAGP
jgi:hypothetical protein